MPTPEQRPRLPLSPALRILAIVAVALIGYSYLYALPAGSSGLLYTVRLWGNIPLGIGDDFGILGICVLAILAGYLLAGLQERASWPAGPSRRSLLAVVGQLACCYLLVLVPALTFSGAARHTGVLVTLLVLPLFGETVRLTESGRIRAWQAGGVGVACLILVTTADHSYATFADRWYPLTMLYAALAVLFAARMHRAPTHTPLHAPSDTPTVPVARPDYYHGLDVLRVVSSCCVIYTHLCNWFSVHHIDWRALAWTEHRLRGNLHLDRHLSLFGVLTFLVISGIVVTHVAYKETGRVFLWRRASRVLPLMIVITAGVWVLMKFGLDVGDDHPDGATAYDLLANIDFSAFFSAQPLFMLAVTWTLLVQLVFYAYIALTIRLLRRHAWLVPALGTVLCFVVATLTAARGNGATHEIASIAVYLPVLFLGQLVPLVRTKRVHPAVATVIGIADYLVVVWSDYLGLGIMRPVDAVPRTLVVVFAMVLLTMSVRNRLTTSTIVREWSRRTYAIYLVHCAVVYPLLRLLVTRISPLPAVLVALAATAIVVEVLYRFVEMPIDRAVRRRRRPPPPASGGGRASARAGERVAQHSGS